MPSNNVTATINAGHQTIEVLPATPLMVSDIINITSDNIGNTGVPAGQAVSFLALDGTGLYTYEPYGNRKTDGGIVSPAQPLIIFLQTPIIIEGDGTIPIEYEGGTVISYLPIGTFADINYYIGSDGSSYFDAALTQLARQAP